MSGTRRGHNEGTIYQRERDGVWIAQMTVENGRRKTWHGKTRQEVQKKLTAAKRDRDQGMPVLRATQTLAQWIESWLEAKHRQVEESTWIRYGELLHLHVVPHLGKTRLEQLSPQQVQRLYADLLAGGLSTSTVARVHTCLFGCLEGARRMQLIARNVCELVSKPRDTEHEIHPLNEAQAQHLLATATLIADPYLALYTLAIATGMRQGEMLALRWRDVDLGDASLQVRASLRRINGVFTRKRPKTRRSERRIALAPYVVEALRAHRLRQLKARHEVGPAWTDMDLVFCDELGREIAAERVRAAFQKLLKTAGLPRIRFHDLRHTAATILLGRRVNPKIVSEMLGHASISITLDIYSHVLPDMQQDAAAIMHTVLAHAPPLPGPDRPTS